MVHRAADRAGLPRFQPLSKDAGLLIQKRLVFPIVFLQQYGRFFLCRQVQLPGSFPLCLLGLVLNDITDQLLQLFPFLMLLLLLPEQFFFFRPDGFQALIFFLQSFRFGSQRFLFFLQTGAVLFLLRFPGLRICQSFFQLRQPVIVRQTLVNGGNFPAQPFQLRIPGPLRIPLLLPLLQQKPGACLLRLCLPQRLLGFLKGFRFGQQRYHLFHGSIVVFFRLFQGFLQVPVFFQKLLQQPEHLRHGKFSVLCLCSGLCVQGAFLPKDALHILPEAALDVLPLVFYLVCLFAEPLLELHIQAGMEDVPENLLPLLGFCQQQLQEISLGNHGHLGKLFPVQTQNLPDCRVDFPGFGDGCFAGTQQGRSGGLFGHALAASFRAHIFRIPDNDVLLSGVTEAQLHLCGGSRVGIFGPEHPRFPVAAAGFTEEGEADGIENRGLSCAGVTGNQVQAFPSQGIKIQFHPSGIGAKGGHGQFQRSHLVPSQISSISAVINSCWMSDMG